MSSVAPKSSVPVVAGQAPSSANDRGGHPLRSMVIASKRFGSRGWFVIHPVDAGPEAAVGEHLQELHAPLVVPIIVVTATVAQRERIVNDLLRYVEGGTRHSIQNERAIIQLDELRVDTNAHRVIVGNEEVILTNLEFRLLAVLIERRDRVQTRGALLEEVWGLSRHSTTRTVDTHVKRLRDKLRTAGRFLHCVRGVGYRFSQDPAPPAPGERNSSGCAPAPLGAPSASAGTAARAQPAPTPLVSP